MGVWRITKVTRGWEGGRSEGDEVPVDKLC